MSDSNLDSMIEKAIEVAEKEDFSPLNYLNQT